MPQFTCAWAFPRQFENLVLMQRIIPGGQYRSADCVIVNTSLKFQKELPHAHSKWRASIQRSNDLETQEFRWGILGLGRISHKFAIGLQSTPGATIAAVGSRSKEKAVEFGKEFSADRCHGSYADLAADPEVDAIYIGTPHPMHHEDTLLCLRAGKAVLCEKPFTINAKQAEELVAESRNSGVFLMEAMWTRYLPTFVRLRELVNSGAIGEVRQVQADFGFRTGLDPEGRLFKLELGGGSLLDVGVYPVSLSSMLLGKPTEIKSFANLGSTGVDEEAAILMTHEGGRLAVLTSAIRLTTPHFARVLGTEGSITVPPAWWCATGLTLSKDGKDETIDLPLVGNGYNYQAEEVQRCVRAGAIESSTMPHAETLEIMRTLDTIRGQWGLKYPGE